MVSPHRSRKCADSHPASDILATRSNGAQRQRECNAGRFADRTKTSSNAKKTCSVIARHQAVAAVLPEARLEPVPSHAAVSQLSSRNVRASHLLGFHQQTMIKKAIE
jgi:hypothetical protein